MSFAPRDSHEAQVQFALERGVPAVIGVLGTIKLPYPSRAFDMAHCSRCLIPWGANGKMALVIDIVSGMEYNGRFQVSSSWFMLNTTSNTCISLDTCLTCEA